MFIHYMTLCYVRTGSAVKAPTTISSLRHARRYGRGMMMFALALTLTRAARAATDNPPGLSEAETERLLREAEGWRSGLRNGTRSLRRAVEMYELAADSGSGVGARHGAFELGRLLERGCAWPSLGASSDDGPALCARDLPGAIQRFGAAARSGHPAAQFGVAVALGSDAFVVGDAEEKEALAAYAAAVGGDTAFGDERARASRDDTAVLHLYFAAAGGDPLANMALGARHLRGGGVPKDCDAALQFYERAADESVKRVGAEGVLRPNTRERLSASGGRVAALETLWDATAGRAVDVAKGLVEHRDRLIKAGRALLQAPREPKGAPPAPPRPVTTPDAPWVAAPGAPAWADREESFWGVGGKPSRGADLLHYHRHAASQGDGASQLALAHLHFHGGRGVAQHPSKAARLFAAAADGAEVDDAAAYGWAGLCYLEGWGVDRDAARAEAWLRQGEKRGDSAALDGLGLLLLRRATGKSERDAAAGYFRRASEKGFMDALYHLGLYQLGWDGRSETEVSLLDGFARKLQKQEKRSGRKDAQKALQFFSLAAQNGHVRALHKVGRMYAKALGVRRSCDVAANAYKTVSERGPWVVQLTEAHAVYRRGDVDGARRAYARLAEAGYEVAQANAAWLVDHEALSARRSAVACLGTSIEDCEGRARRLYELAATQGNADAALRLGDMTLRVGDADKAIAHYQAAHELRHAQATFSLAWCYQRGLGVRRDLHLAKRHFGLAAEADADAAWPVRLALGLLYAEWGFQEAARRRPGVASKLGRLYDAFGAAARPLAPWNRKWYSSEVPHDAAAATLAAMLVGLVALRLRARRRVA